MKRDLSLIRNLLLEIESEEITKGNVTTLNDKKHLHLLWLIEAKYIIGEMDGSGKVYPERLTWEGNEYLDAVRNEKVWKKLSKRISDFGSSVSVEIVKKLASDIIIGII